MRFPCTQKEWRRNVEDAPVVQLLIDPGEEADGAIGERIAKRLRFGGLQHAVARPLCEEPVCPDQAGLFVVRVG